jgi:hypothetical protein
VKRLHGNCKSYDNEGPEKRIIVNRTLTHFAVILDRGYYISLRISQSRQNALRSFQRDILINSLIVLWIRVVRYKKIKGLCLQ